MKREASCVSLPEDKPMDDELEAVFEMDGEPSMTDPEIRSRWIEEAERRAEELRSGKVRGEPAGEVLARIRARLR